MGLVEDDEVPTPSSKERLHVGSAGKVNANGKHSRGPSIGLLAPLLQQPQPLRVENESLNLPLTENVGPLLRQGSTCHDQDASHAACLQEFCDRSGDGK